MPSIANHDGGMTATAPPDLNASCGVLPFRSYYWRRPSVTGRCSEEGCPRPIDDPPRGRRRRLQQAAQSERLPDGFGQIQADCPDEGRVDEPRLERAALWHLW